jgi:hypothetical protein
MFSKVLLTLSGLFLSLNVFAATSANISNAVASTFQGNSPTNSQNQTTAIIYGGQDMSQKKIAIAHESFIKTDTVLTG